MRQKKRRKITKRKQQDLLNKNLFKIKLISANSAYHSWAVLVDFDLKSNKSKLVTLGLQVARQTGSCVRARAVGTGADLELKLWPQNLRLVALIVRRSIRKHGWWQMLGLALIQLKTFRRRPPAGLPDAGERAEDAKRGC